MVHRKEPGKEEEMTVGANQMDDVDIHSAGRHNIRIFFAAYLLIYFAAPVIYVGVVQAALCDKLGAGATIANLPASAYLFGCLAPIFLSRVIPYRLERSAIVGSYLLTSVLLASIFAALILPLGNGVRIVVIIAQGLIQGFASSVAQVYTYQCLGRGTTEEQRARAMKLTFTYGPVAAVLGSLGAQLVLNSGIPFLPYPYDFAFLYLLSVPCTAGVAYLTSRFKLSPVEEPAGDRDQPFIRYISHAVKSYAADRKLLMLFFAYLFWYFTLNAMPNLSLYTREAMGRDPTELSGVVMALRFGFKSLGGFVLGAMALRHGPRSPLLTAVLLLGAATAWAWFVRGYAFLFAFGLMGAGELGGAYFPNYALTLSSPATGARNLALLTLATPAASIAPAVHGALTDSYGFPASFAFGIGTASLSLFLVLKLPSGFGAGKDSNLNPAKTPS